MCATIILNPNAMQQYSFKPRLIPGIAVALVVVLFVNLGLWQGGKAERRQAEINQFNTRARLGPYRITAALVEPELLQDAPVAVRGVYEPEHQFFVDNRQEDGKPGLHVVTPLRIEGSTTRVLVNRGWVPWGASRAELPVVSTPAGEVQVNGIAAVPSNKKFFLMPEHEEPREQLWSRLDLQRFRQLHAAPLQGIAILQNQDDAVDGMVRHWPPPEDRVAKHQSYSMQWFVMAIGLVIFYGVASLRKRVSA